VKERTKISHVLRAYESWLRDSVKPLTYKAYMLEVKRFLEFIEKAPGEVSALNASLWYSHLREQGFSERSICRMGWALRNFFKAMGLLEVTKLIPTPHYEAKTPVWLEEAGLRENHVCHRLRACVEARGGPSPKSRLLHAASKMMRVRRLEDEGF